MLESQRHHFSLEPGITYLDSASMAPLPRSAELVAREAASAKARPWARDRVHAQAQAGVLRGLAAQFVGARAGDMAIVCAASYGLSVAARNLHCAPGERILVLEADHTSQMLTWGDHARRCGAVLDVVRRPVDGNWTSAVMEHLDQSDARPVSIASLNAAFWLDGSSLDLRPVCARLRAMGARIVLDVTQSAGVMDTDVRELDPDFLVYSAYKWVLGPYSMAFLYVAPRWQDTVPLEQNGFNRDGSGAYAEGAARFDMGERDTFVGMPTAIESMSLVASWDRGELRERLTVLTDQMAQQLTTQGFDCVPKAHRSPHILGVRGVPDGVAAACKAQGVYFTQRGNGLRISPHVFNTQADVEAAVRAIASAVPPALRHS